jgi:dipicolinate synthase subunit B
MSLNGLTIGFGITGSHCTIAEVIPQINRLIQAGANVIPIISNTLISTDTRFGSAIDWQKRLKDTTRNGIIATIVDAEHLGPEKKLDIMVIAPCTGTSTSKLANAITDSAVLMAAKAQMRNQKPVIIGISTNDGLGLNAANIAKLLAAKGVFFVPFGQDDPVCKPNSLVARMELIKETCEAALLGKQLQPLLIEKYHDLED